MIGTVEPEVGKVDARTLPRVFTNDTRCEQCQSPRVRVHYDPGCREIGGAHFHRLCEGCGHTWAERTTAGHGGFVDLSNPAFVLVCQSCGSRVPEADATAPRCCRRPEVSYHDSREPCVLCSEEREPGMEG